VFLSPASVSALLKLELNFSLIFEHQSCAIHLLKGTCVLVSYLQLDNFQIIFHAFAEAFLGQKY